MRVRKQKQFSRDESRQSCEKLLETSAGQDSALNPDGDGALSLGNEHNQSLPCSSYLPGGCLSAGPRISLDCLEGYGVFHLPCDTSNQPRALHTKSNTPYYITCHRPTTAFPSILQILSHTLLL